MATTWFIASNLSVISGKFQAIKAVKKKLSHKGI